MKADAALREALRGTAVLPGSAAAAFTGFLDEYFGRAGEVPFGGRDTEYAALDAWLLDPERPFALVLAGAGLGKSALLARWAATIAAAGSRVVFVPLSIRLGTGLRGEALRLLAHQLAAATGRPLPEVKDTAALRAECAAALRTPGQSGASFLIVLDGIDEAVDWEPGVELGLAAADATHIKILLSARSTPMLESAQWLARLAIPQERTQVLTLTALQPEAVRAMLVQQWPGEAATASALAQELQRLTQGDPLLIRLYVSALLSTTEKTGWLHPAQLPDTPPGLGGWFARFWDQLRRQWAAEPAIGPVAETVFDLLAIALGPLQFADLLALQDHGTTAPILSAALRALQPLLLGDGKQIPLSLCHPRLRYFRLENKTPEQQQSLHQRLLTFAETQQRELLAGSRAPEEVSAYVVRYLGAHLQSSDPSDVRLFTLVCPPWQKAWEALEGTFDGFRDDVERAWQAAEALARAAPSQRPQALAMAARCGLVFSSIASLSYQLPPNLVGHLVELGIFSPAVALSRVRRPQGDYPAAALTALAPWLDTELALRVLAEASRGHQPYDLEQAEGLGCVISRLVALGKTSELLAVIEGFPSATRALLIAVSWRTIPRDTWPAAARWLVEGAPRIGHCSHAASAVFAALPILSTADCAAAVRRALTRLDDEDFGLDPEHAALLGAAGDWQHGWELGQRETMAYPRARMLAHVVPYLPEALRTQGYSLWFAAYLQAAADSSLLALEIPRGLDKTLADDVLRFVQAAQQRGDRGAVRPLIKLAYQFPELRALACAAVVPLTGADGALARLAIAPVLAAADAEPLALQAYQMMLALVEQHEENSLTERDRVWPRDPDFMPWTYMGAWRPAPVLLVAALRFLGPRERARCTRELLGRFRHIGDGDAALATAATLAAALPQVTREQWSARLGSRLRPGEDNPVTLARLAALTTGPQRAALAEAAWQGRIAPDNERRVGAALAQACAWIDPALLPEIQVAALTRWNGSATKPQWTSLLEALGKTLTPPALQWMTAQVTHHSRILVPLLPLLPEPARQREAERWLTTGMGFSFYWHDEELRTACRYTQNAGDLLYERLSQSPALGPMVWGGETGELAVAYAIAPLLEKGHRQLAAELRSKLSRLVAQRVADLAFARHDTSAQQEHLLRAALNQKLPAQPYEVLTLFESALEWFAPLGFLPTILEQIRQQPDLWLDFARLLQKHGYHDALRSELSASRITALGTNRLRLDPALWLSHATPEQAIECWQHHFRAHRNDLRRQVLAGSYSRWFTNLTQLVDYAAGPAALAQVAETVLEVTDWFP